MLFVPGNAQWLRLPSLVSAWRLHWHTRSAEVVGGVPQPLTFRPTPVQPP